MLMRFRDLPIAVKFSLLLLPAVACLLTGLAVIQSSLSSASLEGKALAELKQNNELVVGMMDAFNKSLKHTVLRQEMTRQVSEMAEANSVAIRETSGTARQLEELSRSLQDCTSRFKLA